MSWVVGLVLLCLFVQALLIPAQRISERSHFHVNSSTGGRAGPAWVAPTADQSVVRAVFEHRATVITEEAPHQHTGLQDHDHGDRVDVVYVKSHGDESNARHALSTKRLLLDQDGLWTRLLSPVVIACARVAYAKSTVLLRTRTELPLDRPPC